MKWKNVLVVGLIFTCSCGAIRRMGVNSITPTFDEVMAAAYELNDPLIMKEGLPSNIILLEGLSRISPKNSKLLTLTAQAYCSYAMGFIEDTDPERAKKLYLRGRDYGIRALLLDGRVKKILKKAGVWESGDNVKKINELRKAFESLEKGKINEKAEIIKSVFRNEKYKTLKDKLDALREMFPPSQFNAIKEKIQLIAEPHKDNLSALTDLDFKRMVIGVNLTDDEYKDIVSEMGLEEKLVPALFWTGNCWGSWLNLSKKEVTALLDASNVLFLMKAVRALNDRYFYGGSHLFFALYYSTLPPFLGGGPEKAKEEFEYVFKLTEGKFLLAKVFFARFYATLIKDEKLFEETLNEVLQTPSNVKPELTLMNEIAKMKAKLYLSQKDQLF